MIKIRKYTSDDLPMVEQINGFCALQIKYHKGVKEDNVFCAVDSNAAVIGVGLLIVPQMIAPKGLHKIEFATSIQEEHKKDNSIDSLLTDALIGRFHEIKRENPDIKYAMRVCCETDEISAMQFFLEKGFSLHSVIPVLKFDLANQIKHHDIPDDITIQKLVFTEQSMKSYIQADFDASTFPDNEADAWFRTGIPTYSCFTAMKDNEVIGAVSVWNISEDRAATENIFVVPQHRRKNIARELISTAFDELKGRGMKVATLSVSGTNLSAMKLYLTCGYTLYYNLLEMLYE